MAKKVTVKIEGKETVSKASKKASTGVNNLAKDAKKISAGMVAGWAAATAAVGGVIIYLNKTVGVYRIQEQAQAKLAAAIKATGRESDISIESMYALAGELQQVTLYGDEATISATGLLQSLADLDEQGLQRVTPGLLDFATAMDMKLQAAASLFGKTINSTTNALSRYGIEIDTSADKQEKLRQLTEQIEKKFGGMAEAMGSTATGAMTQLKNAFGDLQEVSGQMIAEGLEPITRWLTEIISKAASSAREMRAMKEVLQEWYEGKEIENKTLLLDALEQKWRDVSDQLKVARDEEGKLRAGRGARRGSTESEIAALEEIQKSYAQQLVQLRATIDLEERLARTRDEAAGKIQELTADQKLYAGVLEGLKERLREINELGEIFGDNYDTAAEKSNALKAAIKKLVDEGFTAAGEGLQTLLDSYGHLLIVQDEIKEKVKENTLVFDEFGRAIEQVAINLDNLADMEMRAMEIDLRQPSTGGGAAAAGAVTAFDPLMIAIQAVAEAFMGVASIAALLDPLTTILESMMAVLEPLLNQALAPLVGVLVIVGQLLGEMLAPVIEALAPIISLLAQILITNIMPLLNLLAPMISMVATALKILEPIIFVIAVAMDILSRPLEFLADVIMWVVSWFKYIGAAISDFIYNLFHLRNKRDTKGASPGKFSSEAFTRPLLTRADMLAAAGAEYLGGEPGLEAGGVGSSTMIQRAPDIYIYQTFQGHIIGAGGMQEFGEFTADALEEYAGIGGRIHIAEAVV